MMELIIKLAIQETRFIILKYNLYINLYINIWRLLKQMKLKIEKKI
jgi:hypothetical protein